VGLLCSVIVPEDMADLMGTIAFSVGATAASTSTVIIESLAGGVRVSLSGLDQLRVFLTFGVAPHSIRKLAATQPVAYADAPPSARRTRCDLRYTPLPTMAWWRSVFTVSTIRDTRTPSLSARRSSFNSGKTKYV
jgi:hypothetical protein